MGRLVRKPKLRGSRDGASRRLRRHVPDRVRSRRPLPSPATIISTRLVKYIPAEIIGGSMLVNAILAQAVSGR